MILIDEPRTNIIEEKGRLDITTELINNKWEGLNDQTNSGQYVV